MKKRRRNPGWQGSRGGSVHQRLVALEWMKKQAIEDADRKIQAVRVAEAEAIAEVRERGSITPVPGEWYITVYCDGCSSPIRILRDAMKGEVALAGSSILRVICADCGKQVECPSDLAVSFPAAES